MARLQIEDDGILLDFSRQRLTTKTVQLLIELAEATGLRRKIRAMAAGEEINYTEGRPVMHMALRAPRGDKLEVGGVDVVAQVHPHQAQPQGERRPTRSRTGAPAKPREGIG